MNAGRILVASSGEQTREELRQALELEGHLVLEAQTAQETIQYSSRGLLDLLIIDATLDAGEPCQICRAIRKKSDAGIIFICPDDSTQGRIDALNSGVDDLLLPGFTIPESSARVRALLRRVTTIAGNRKPVLLQDRAIDFQRYEISGPHGRIARLTPKECLVLRHLVSHANQPFTPQTLARSIWQRDGQGSLEFVRIVVKQLRQKLEPDPEKPRYILTQRPLGYQFQMPA
jgi:DNA-binding response OmpR family regulator